MLVATKNKNEILKLTPTEIQVLILDNLGLKVGVINKNNKIFIALLSYQSCFRLMERLHWDCDFIVHKKDKKYIIEL